LPFMVKVAILPAQPQGWGAGAAMMDRKRGAGRLVLGLGLGLMATAITAMTASGAAAQGSDMRLIRDPVYGELRDVLGATLPVATPSPKCARPAQLPDGACLDSVLAGMKARGATTARVLTGPGA